MQRSTASLLRELAQMAIGPPSSRAALIGENWKFFMQAATAHRLTPMLGYQLPDFPDVDAGDADFGGASTGDVVEFYRAAAHLNRRRNQNILITAEKAIRVLNAIEVVPTLLKGLAFIHDENEHALSTRAMSDVDILVKKTQYDDAIRALQANGFRCESASEKRYFESLPVSTRREYAMMHDGSPVFIDLHRDLFLPFSCPGRTTEEIIDQSDELSASMGKYRVPRDTDRLLHSIFHSEVQNYGYRRGAIDLRQLLDARLLIKDANSTRTQKTCDFFRENGHSQVSRQWQCHYDAMVSPNGDIAALGWLTKYRLEHPRFRHLFDSIYVPAKQMMADPVRFLRPATWSRYFNRRRTAT